MHLSGSLASLEHPFPSAWQALIRYGTSQRESGCLGLLPWLRYHQAQVSANPTAACRNSSKACALAKSLLFVLDPLGYLPAHCISALGRAISQQPDAFTRPRASKAFVSLQRRHLLLQTGRARLSRHPGTPDLSHLSHSSLTSRELS